MGPEWHAGFMSQNDLTTIDWNTVSFNEPTLIIIDYVTNQDKLQAFTALLRSLKERRPAIEHKVRILVLERQPYNLKQESTESNWYESALSNATAPTR